MPPFSTCSRAQVKLDLSAHIPRLRAFALSFCGSADQADDLVQETLVRAWSHRDSFIEGNLSAWLFTILRNVYFSQYRKGKREIPDIDGIHASTLAVAPGQTSHMDMLDFRIALARLPASQREALLLVGAAGHSYIEVAEICGCAVGTIKSRVNRARQALAEMLRIDPLPDLIETTDATGRKPHRETEHCADPPAQP
ncbi:RNA polymerase subunit sigma [Rhodoblastus sphagnicola]|uniref:RNA polymerase sigma factor n=1 Tax=Rhodoblastus sphagnicola TaxID=333368 RepID=A0A2S6N1U2_9HYPH|nr:sigma-70 family RNA polymerase sigma factor [Rhodoblastus sphagnicola]MBB4198243.1 RNA polymerase sigma-70 factor (ECF subfamily) [Rhodoblastus sphagnicola]PPQ28597.1 RNA polymerase subunit sigma [Rhodoblastus sphagnicola]